jgi:hypothetical protein
VVLLCLPEAPAGAAAVAAKHLLAAPLQQVPSDAQESARPGLASLAGVDPAAAIALAVLTVLGCLLSSSLLVA